MAIRLKVVIPVYRGAAVIGETLRALVGQVTDHMALAIAINGPPDGADAVVRPILNAIAARGAWTGVQTLVGRPAPHR